VKAAVSYSMCTLNNKLKNDYFEDAIIQNQQNYNRLDTIIDDVISAQSKLDVLQYINEYRNTFFPILFPR